MPRTAFFAPSPVNLRGASDTGDPEGRDFLETRLRFLVGERICLRVINARVSGQALRRSQQESELGRQVLNQVMQSTGQHCDVSPPTFPHPRLSVTHSAGTAVAAAARDSDVNGLGVDLEFRRPEDLRIATLFLTGSELRWWRHSGLGPAHSLRQLWTVKEAAFKSDLDNSGQRLRDYDIAELTVLESRDGTSQWSGRVSRGQDVFEFRTLGWPDAAFSIALRRNGVGSLTPVGVSPADSPTLDGMRTE